jgi:hypothetical protein
MDVAQRYQDQLERIKKNVRSWHDYFKHNYDRYNEFRRFVFESSLREEDITLLMTLSKPQLEFNVLEAYISRLLGEFSKQEPDIKVSADDQNTADPLTIRILEQHLRHVLSDSNNENMKYEIYKDLLSGGFSVLKICTDYANPMSFQQVIKMERVFDPTLCGFDQLARDSHKGDGRFCFELFPMEKERFKEEYPGISLDHLSFRRDLGGFNWSYLNDNGEYLILADYYEKKVKHKKIVQLRDGKVITLKQYESMLANWNDFAQAPAIIGKPRKTEIETICRYRIIENKVIEYVETDFSYLPLIFADGNSIMLKTPKNGNVRQYTRPYVYHAKSAQRLKNFAGIALANEIENIVQHKFIIKKEALPKEEDLLQAIKDVQKPNNVIINAFYEEDPNMPIPEPIREIVKLPAPPEVLQGFQTTDSLMQNILGSYDASLGINNNQLSGIAIVEAATQSNSAAMPYVVGFMHCLQRAAEVYVDLLPKYYTTPRTIPVIDEEGKRSFVKINGEDGVNMFYDANALNVMVKAGASFQVQKSRTIMMVKEMMGMSPLFAQFIAEKGLNFVLDNMEGKGIEQLKQMTDQWVKEMEQQKQMAMQQQQQQMQNNPLVQRNQLLAKQLELANQKAQNEFTVDMLRIKQDDQKVLAEMHDSLTNAETQRLKARAEVMSHQIDANLKHQDQLHRHAKDTIEIRHKMNKKSQLEEGGYG